MKMDSKFEQYFDGRLKQLFLYITDRCDLNCEQCLYKTTLAAREFEPDTAIEILRVARGLGAEKLTLIGGEPSLYRFRDRGASLAKVLAESRRIGYRYVRMDTNGQRYEHLATSGALKHLDNYAVSLDGHNPETNDLVRGSGTFERAVEAIGFAASQSLYTTVTTCVHRGNLASLDSVIELCLDLGVSELNFHPLFKMGIERDVFSGETDITPESWLGAYPRLVQRRDALADRLEIRAPMRFVHSGLYERDPDSFNYCPTRMGERVLFHPNGEIRICALCIGTPLTVANLSENVIQWTGDESELDPDRLLRTPCMSQERDFGELVPLCISYKPGQSEYVWAKERFDEVYPGTSVSLSNV